MVDKDKLRGYIRLKGYTLKQFCEKIGISESAFIRKQKNDTFGIDEVKRIIECLGIPMNEAITIFLPN